MPAPTDVGHFARVVVGIIIFRHVNGQTFIHVAVVFGFEGEWVIFGVTRDVEVTSSFVTDDIHA